MSAPVLVGLSAAGRAAPTVLMMALPGLVFVAGYDHLAYGLGILAGVVLAGLLIAPCLAHAPEATISARLRDAFGPVTAAVAGLFIVLIAIPLLAAELALVARVGAYALGAATPLVIAAVLVFAVIVALVPDRRPLAVLGGAAWLMIAASLVVPLLLLALNTQGGLAFPHIAYGALLPELQAVEETLVQNGLVDFDTFSAHTAPFIRLIERDFIALVLTLALGMAVLPHLTGVLAVPHRPAATRLAGAWAALFVMIVLISAPALAVYVKHAIYGAMVNGAPLASLPAWLEAPLDAGLAELHGTSVHLLREVVAAAQAGSRSAADMADALSGTAAGAQWRALDPEVQQVVFAAAAHHIVDPASATLSEIYRSTVLPAAAAAAGNVDAVLTQSALAMEPLGLLFAIPALTGSPELVSLLIAAAAGVSALAVAAAVLRGVLHAVPGRAIGATGLCGIARVLAVGALAGGVALSSVIDPIAVAVSALAIAAGSLFPAFALGLVWRRATAAGVIAAMLAGGAVTGYYMAATQLYPATFYATWSALSDAPDYAAEEYEALAEQARDAATVGERREIEAQMDELARGSASRAGLANWGGIDTASSGVFGAAAGFALLIVVSLLTPRRRPRAQP